MKNNWYKRLKKEAKQLENKIAKLEKIKHCHYKYNIDQGYLLMLKNQHYYMNEYLKILKLRIEKGINKDGF